MSVLIVFFAGLLVASLPVTAAELTLFDQPLRTVSRQEFRRAAEQSGARLTSTSAESESYDVRAIGLPGARTMEVVFVDGRFVLAQYAFEPGDKGSAQKLRQMLLAKYGEPKTDRPGRGAVFGDRDLRDGKYTWVFDDAMELVFAQPFFGFAPRRLTYVHRARLADLRARLARQEREAAQRAAGANRKVF